MFEFDATFWSAVAFVITVVLFIYFGVPSTIGKALDNRARRIKAELDDARRLKDEARALVAEYRAKRESAVKEAEEIVANAKAEAERVAAEAKSRMEDFVARRTKMAETKIAQAEAQALADVRAAAADAAVSAASRILAETVKGPTADALLNQGITEIRQKLN
jgi:F-type H+-transporting ATPase subunit b